MYEEIKSIDFSSEIEINELYHLFKTNSSPMNFEIMAKLQHYSTSSTFFKHYMNKDIKKFYVHMNNFINEISSLTNENKKDLFNAKVDKYISDFSTIYVVFNLITKINDSLESILLNTKDHLSKLYEKYKLDENNREKINQFIQQMLHFSSPDGLKKNFLSKSFDKENSNICFKEFNEKEYSKSNKEQILIDNLLGKDQLSFKDVDNTPRFNIDDISMNDIDSQINKITLKKKKSFDSQFTLSSNKRYIIENEEKENMADNKMHNISKIKIDKEDDDINYYITNINPEDDQFKKHKKKDIVAILNQKKVYLKINKLKKFLKKNYYLHIKEIATIQKKQIKWIYINIIVLALVIYL